MKADVQIGMESGEIPPAQASAWRQLWAKLLRPGRRGRATGITLSEAEGCEVFEDLVS